jgi:hypothetical protein
LEAGNVDAEIYLIGAKIYKSFQPFVDVTVEAIVFILIGYVEDFVKVQST